jgi:hypothetical protein
MPERTGGGFAVCIRVEEVEMAIDAGYRPPIDKEPCSLRADLLEALRRKAFELYVNCLPPAGDSPLGASELDVADAHAFADAIVAAITVEVFDSALSGRSKAATSSLADLLPSSPLRH